MPFGLFKKKVKEVDEQKLKQTMEGIDKALTEPKFIEDLKLIEKTEIKDLDKMKEIVPPVKPPVLEELKPVPIEPVLKPLDENSLEQLNERIDTELVAIRKKLKGIEKVPKLTLESPEMVDLLDLHISAKNKFKEFVDEINKFDLKNSEKKTFAAIYKFRACKALSEIKKQIRKIESISMKAGFIPTKVHTIIQSDAEKLVNNFLKEKK